MKTFPLNEIVIPKNRQRTIFDKASIRELADKIHGSYNLQLPGVWLDDAGRPVLVWGERRFRAITLLAGEGKQYRIPNGYMVPLGHIAVETLDTLATDVTRAEMELSENIDREELPWHDRVRAYATIHVLKQAQNPKQTVLETAKTISDITGLSVASLAKSLPSKSTIRETKVSTSVPVALAISKHLNDPDVAKAASVNAAFAIIAKKAEVAATAALIKRRKERGALTGEIVDLKYGDATLLMKDVTDKTIDLILTDPPYGVNADSDNFNRRFSGANQHVYADDPTKAKEFMQWLLLEGFRVAKERANLFIFCDSKHYTWLSEAAARAAWSPFPRPIIWDKMSPGISPWQDNGFGTSYEMIFFATKGRRGLHTTLRDVLQHKRVVKENKIHAAQKPDSLLQQLIAVSTIPGEMVLDPCAGSGSTLIACRTLQRRALGFEMVKSIYDAALVNIFPQNSGTQNATT